MTRQSGLGRGLDALIETSQHAADQGVHNVPIENISANPRQPRSNFDEEGIKELSTSIKNHGIIQPIIVTLDPSQSDRYILVAGERRLIAAQKAGLQSIPIIIREVSDRERLEIALIENLQRSDLNPLEEAEAYRQLIEDFNLTHEEIAVRVAKSRAEVTNTLRLLALAPKVQDALIEGGISKGHARAIVSLPNWQAQNAVLRSVTDKDLNVRQTEELVKRISGQKTTPRLKPDRAPEIAALENELRAQLGAKVSIKQYRRGGSITIRYFSDEELNDILSRISKEVG
jgi:ParB family chromosome partitioning protein